MPVLQVRLTDEELAALKSVAAKRGTTMTAMVKGLVFDQPIPEPPPTLVVPGTGYGTSTLAETPPPYRPTFRPAPKPGKKK